MIIDALKKETAGMSDYNLMQLIDFARFLKYNSEKSYSPSDIRLRNIRLLELIRETQNIDDEDYVSDTVVDNALKIVFFLKHQPELFKTYENSINMQFESEDGSYLEFEVFENRISSMMVPERDYDRAVFPVVELGDMKSIDRIVGEFYGQS